MTKKYHWGHGALVTVGLLPITGLALALTTNRLGPEPVEQITHVSGEWALRFLLLTLLVTPLRKFLGWNAIAPYRRTLGLLSFLYASLHFATYLNFELEWGFTDLGKDILERPYITVGFSAFLILAALAATSTRAWMRRLGRHWRSLHSGIYAALVLAILHVIWAVKADLREPLIYAAIAALLLVWRLLGQRLPNYATLGRARRDGHQTTQPSQTNSRSRQAIEQR